jgi:2-desacetyl-2-hydroxyethyl bacteriochlorophyllide A dehydrogenase
LRRFQFSAAEAGEYVDESVPSVAPGHLLIRPLVVGICGTDVELFDGSMAYLRSGITSYPIQPGHEWIGEVMRMAEDVTEFEIGDRVVGECSIGCGHCAVCDIGAYHRCPDRHETGIFGQPGALTEMLLFPARSAFKIPLDVATEDGALVEPLAVAYRALTRLELSADSVVMVVGGGTIGALAVMLLVGVFGLTPAVVDPNAHALSRALSYGAREPSEAEMYSRVLEVSGSSSGLTYAIAHAEAGARIVVAGLTPNATDPLPVNDIVLRDLDVVGSLGSPHVWPAVLEILSSSGIRPSRLITHRFPFDEIPQAMEVQQSHSPENGKLVIVANSEGAGA